MVSRGSHPQMAARFRLVKYSNLPRYMIKDILGYITGIWKNDSIGFRFYLIYNGIVSIM